MRLRTHLTQRSSGSRIPAAPSRAGVGRGRPGASPGRRRPCRSAELSSCGARSAEPPGTGAGGRRAWLASGVWPGCSAWPAPGARPAASRGPLRRPGTPTPRQPPSLGGSGAGEPRWEILTNEGSPGDGGSRDTGDSQRKGIPGGWGFPRSLGMRDLQRFPGMENPWGIWDPPGDVGPLGNLGSPGDGGSWGLWDPWWWRIPEEMWDPWGIWAPQGVVGPPKRCGNPGEFEIPRELRDPRVTCGIPGDVGPPGDVGILGTVGSLVMWDLWRDMGPLGNLGSSGGCGTPGEMWEPWGIWNPQGAEGSPGDVGFLIWDPWGIWDPQGVVGPLERCGNPGEFGIPRELRDPRGTYGTPGEFGILRGDVGSLGNLGPSGGDRGAPGTAAAAAGTLPRCSRVFPPRGWRGPGLLPEAVPGPGLPLSGVGSGVAPCGSRAAPLGEGSVRLPAGSPGLAVSWSRFPRARWRSTWGRSSRYREHRGDPAESRQCPGSARRGLSRPRATGGRGARGASGAGKRRAVFWCSHGQRLCFEMLFLGMIPGPGFSRQVGRCWFGGVQRVCADGIHGKVVFWGFFSVFPALGL
uniref:Uncharacterized protein n=1 Tax=Cyanoderma ruficeps TaxID=181631 RepID=A0A8C3NXW9_9PASS